MKIAVITNKNKDTGLMTATKVAKFLCGKAEVFMSNDTVLDSSCGVTYTEPDELFCVSDLAIVIGGELGGVLGMFVGIPFTAVIYTIIIQDMEKRALQKQQDKEKAEETEDEKEQKA